MSMNSSRNCVQLYIENKLGCTDLSKWSSYKSKLEQLTLNEEDELQLNKLVVSDATSYYIKAVISFSEAISGLKKNRSSWSVVKFYYSVFYLIRADLLLEDYFLVRCKGFYYSKVKNNEKIQKFQPSSIRGDHQLTTHFYNKLHREGKHIDPLQDGEIDDCLPYLWLMSQREKINYQSKDFEDPGIVECLQKPAIYIREGREKDLLSMYESAEDFIYCFDKDHACIAIPYCKIIETGRKLKNKHSVLEIPEHLFSHIKSIVNISSTYPLAFL